VIPCGCGPACLDRVSEEALTPFAPIVGTTGRIVTPMAVADGGVNIGIGTK
jgi:hypothetical protein